MSLGTKIPLRPASGSNGASLQAYQEGAHFEALIAGVLMAPLDPRYTQVGFNSIFVQVCLVFHFGISLSQRSFPLEGPSQGMDPTLTYLIIDARHLANN